MVFGYTTRVVFPPETDRSSGPATTKRSRRGRAPGRRIAGGHEVEVGRGARLPRCIVDKGVRIPPGEVIGEDPERDARRFTRSEGGVVVVSREDLGQRDEFDVEAA